MALERLYLFCLLNTTPLRRRTDKRADIRYYARDEKEGSSSGAALCSSNLFALRLKLDRIKRRGCCRFVPKDVGENGWQGEGMQGGRVTYYLKIGNSNYFNE